MRPIRPTDRLVRYQYVESLLEGDLRVLEIGCGVGDGAEFLSRRAKEVVALESSPLLLEQAKRERPQPNISYQLLEGGRFPAQTREFDAILVPQAERWGSLPWLVDAVKRALSPHGFALFVTPTADLPQGIDYAPLLEELSSSFGQVSMLGEMPFFGFTIAEFEPEAELVPQLDCTLVEEDEPSSVYIALCSDRPLPHLGYSVIQVPTVDGEIATPGYGRERRRSGERMATDGDESLRQGSLASSEPDDSGHANASDLRAAWLRERERFDQIRRLLQAEQERSERTTATMSTVRGDAERALVRAEAAEAALAEVRVVAEQHKQRAEAAEQRCDALVNRIEHDAAELSRLHQALAEHQAHQQSDAWRLEELSGRLRETEARLIEAVPKEEDARAPLSDRDDAREGCDRCQRLQAQVDAQAQKLADQARELDLAQRAANKNVLQDLRARTQQVTRLEQRLKEANAELDVLRAQGAGERRQGSHEDNHNRGAARPGHATPIPAPGSTSPLKDADAMADPEVARLRQKVKHLSREVEALREALAAAGSRKSVREATREEAMADRGEAAADGGGGASAAQLEMLLQGAALHKEQTEAMEERLHQLDLILAARGQEAAELEEALAGCRQRLAGRDKEVRELAEQARKAGLQRARLEGRLRRERG